MAAATSKRKTGSVGIRYTTEESLILDGLQTFIRSEGLKVSDSGVFRGMASIAEPDDDMVARTIEVGDTRHLVSVETSVSLGMVAHAQVLTLLETLNVRIKGNAKRGGAAASINDVLRAMLYRFRTPDLPLLGAVRMIAAEDRERKQRRRGSKA